MAIDSQNNSSSESLLDELAEEFTLRVRQGEHPALSEFIERHPQLEHDIRDLFPALVEMERLDGESLGAKDEAVVWTNAAGERLERLGDYRIIREIGRGGMGVVFEVEQISLGRRVALKALPVQFTAHTNQKERFSREARAAARLHHTNIVPVFGVGEQDGVPYYVMQYIRGLGLDAVLQEVRATRQTGVNADAITNDDPQGTKIDRRSLTAHSIAAAAFSLRSTSQQDTRSSNEPNGRVSGADERTPLNVPAATMPSASTNQLTGDSAPGFASSSSGSAARRSYAHSVARIGMEVADAIHYAHSMGIQHRDIKPSNLLIDEAGTVWVTDFGLAKIEDLPDLTKPGDFLGTLRYSAPETLNGQAGPCSDQFSLGVTLYEMLTLQPAFTASSPPKLIEAIRAGSVTPIRRLAADTPTDLETIVRKTMSPLPQDRYRSLKSLRDDLQRFLAGEPIQARRLNPVQRLAKWSAKRPAIAGLLAFSLLSVVAFVVLLIVSRNDLKFERDALRVSEQLANRRKIEAEISKGEAEQASALLANNVRRLRTERAEDLFRVGQSSAAAALLAQVVRDDPTDRIAAHRLVSALEQYRFLVPATPPLVHEDRVSNSRMSPDGRWMVCADVKGRISIWNVATGRRVAGPILGLTAVSTLRFSPDSQSVACGFEDGSVALLSTDDGQMEGVVPPQPGSIAAIAFHPSVQQLAVVRSDRVVQLLNRADLSLISGFRIDARNAVHFAEYISPDRLVVGLHRHVVVVEPATGSVQHSIRITQGGAGRTPNFCLSDDRRKLVVGTLKGAAHLIDLNAGSLLLSRPVTTEKIRSVRFSRHQPWVVIASYDAKVRVWNYETDTIEHEIPHDDQVQYADFSPDGQFIISASNDDTVRVWNAADASLVVEPARHRSAVMHIDVHPSGHTIASRSDSNEVRLFAFQQPVQTSRWLREGERAASVGYSSDGQRIAVGLFDGTVVIADSRSGQTIEELAVGAVRAKSVKFSPDDRRLLVIYGDADAVYFDTSEPGHSKQLVTVPGIWQADFSHDGTRIATAGKDGKTLLIDAETGRTIRTYSRSDELLRHAFLSKDGGQILSGATSGQLRLFNVQSRQIERTAEHGSRLRCLAFAPSGRFFVSGGQSPMASCWNLSGTTVQKIEVEHGGRINSVNISADEQFVVTTSHDNTARIWYAESMRPVCPPLPHRSIVLNACFSPDGSKVATISNDGATRLWDTMTGQVVQQPLIHDGHARQVCFRPDGRQIAVASNSGAVLWDVSEMPADAVPNWLPAFAEALAGTRVGDGTQLVPLTAAEIEATLADVRGGSQQTAWHQWANQLLRNEPEQVVP